MSVLDRLRDAEILFDNARFEGSLLQLLVATAATSRKRYSRKKERSDKAAFRRFLSDEMSVLTLNHMFHTKRFVFSVCGKEDDLAGHLYEFFRNSLIHEGHIDSRIRLVWGPEFFVGFSDPTCVQLSHWIHRGLYRVLVSVPENKGDGFGREFWQTEILQYRGSYWWAGENWVTRQRASELGIRVFRKSDFDQQTLEELEADPDIVIIREDPVRESTNS